MTHEAPSGPAPTRSPLVAYLLWFFLGSFGAHRFYAGKTGSACGMLGLCIGSFVLTAVFVGLLGFLALFVWWVIDAFKINAWCHETPAVAGSIAETHEAKAAA